ncbi:MAG TPA: hypothetical protein VIY51_07245 [Xanthobacteraceae bacterium]
MHNAPKTTPDGQSRPIEPKADAETAIGHLAELMDGLEALVEEETALVRAGRLCEASRLAPKKAALSGGYFKAVEELKANSGRLSRLPQDAGALARRHDRLQAVLKSNLVVLATAHAVSEGILRRLSGDLARKACPQGYGASGRTTAPDPKRAQPLALSRTL